MDYANMTFEELEVRAAEIVTELEEADKEKIEALNGELDQIEERKKTLEKELAEKRAAAAAVAKGAGEVVEKRDEENNKMTNLEVRKTPEYVDAYAKYVKSGKDAECRALLTELVEDGVVPVPALVENKIRTAWENDKIFSRVTKTYVKGVLRVGFEASATDAAFHEEGTEAPAEEELVLGIVEMVPFSLKKWITVSDEVLALGSEDFLTYLYDEIAYKIVKFAADSIVQTIQSAPAVSDDSHVGVAQIAGEVTPATILQAMAELGDEAENIVIIASGQTIADVRTAALEANYAYDPFFGMEVIQKEGVTGAIVGDLSGFQINLPEGDNVKFKFDDLSLAEQDLVKIVGRLFVGAGVVGPKMFAQIVEEASA